MANHDIFTYVPVLDHDRLLWSFYVVPMFHPNYPTDQRPLWSPRRLTPFRGRGAERKAYHDSNKVWCLLHYPAPDMISLSLTEDNQYYHR